MVDEGIIDTDVASGVSDGLNVEVEDRTFETDGKSVVSDGVDVWVEDAVNVLVVEAGFEEDVKVEDGTLDTDVKSEVDVSITGVEAIEWVLVDILDEVADLEEICIGFSGVLGKVVEVLEKPKNKLNPFTV